MTEAQQRVYAALVTLTRDGWPASVREIAEVAGYLSPATVHVHLEALERQRYAQRHPNAPHTQRGWLAGPRQP